MNGEHRFVRGHNGLAPPDGAEDVRPGVPDAADELDEDLHLGIVDEGVAVRAQPFRWNAGGALAVRAPVGDPVDPQPHAQAAANERLLRGEEVHHPLPHGAEAHDADANFVHGFPCRAAAPRLADGLPAVLPRKHRAEAPERLAGPVLVFDEGEADVAVAQAPESDPGRYRHLAFL